VVREPRPDVVRRGDDEVVLDMEEDLVEVIDVVMVLVEEGLGVGSNVGFAVRVRVVLLVDVLLCVAVEVATTPLMSRLRPLSGSTVEICSGGPTTSWILSAALNVANRIRVAENRFILLWTIIFIGYYDVLMNSLFPAAGPKILFVLGLERAWCRRVY
jgi:hypothetical protein